MTEGTRSELASAAERYSLKLRAENKSPRTLRVYGDALRFLEAFLAAQGMPRTLTAIRREHVEAFIVHELERTSASTAHNRFRALRPFFGWLVEEGELRASPMARMKAPRFAEPAVEVLSAEDLQALLDLCGPRDRAIVLTLIDTGVRLGELLGMGTGDVDLLAGHVLVHGKGGRSRLVPLSDTTAAAILTMLEGRDYGPLWMGERGPLTASGVQLMLKRRGRAAGIAGTVHPHRFRHSFAHHWLLAGGNEGDLMMLAGWRSRAMLDRYGRSAASERARLAHARFSIVERELD